MLSPTTALEPTLVTDCFTRSFEVQAAKTPDHIALEFEGQTITYAQLNARANQIAHALCQRQLQPETRIGICLDRSIAAIECMLGILKAGLAFVPLDPEFPPDRLAYIVEHAGVRRIYCDPQYRYLFASLSAAEVEVDSPDSCRSGQPDTNLDIDIPLSSLAYVMYTSGSTGKPKGVQIEHGSLMTYCLADIEVYRLQPSDRTLQFSTLNFDVAIEEIYPPLLVGSSVVIRPRERADAAIELSHLIEKQQVTALHVATAYWNEWVDLMLAAQARVPDCLRLVIVTGEKISVEHYRRWQSLCDHHVLWCNAYGPTETTVTCTVFIPADDWNDEQMPIGKPLPGYDAFILDQELRPVPLGETGQLFIGGPALARGYLNRPDLTEKAFLDVQLADHEATRRLYRTGDLARWLPSGDIAFAGRVDHQMKIGSYRIEPGEIESVLNLHPQVRESLVTCEEIAGQKYLIGYVVPTDSLLTPTLVADFLRQRLPVYMVPSRYAFLSAMPKTINGKIDRAALPKGEQLQGIALSHSTREPSTELEIQLASIWKEVLQLPAIGVDDDFFHLGGSSLLVARVIAQLSHQLQLMVPVRDFFANPTIATLASHLHTLRGEAPDALSDQHRAALRQRLPQIRALEMRSFGARLAAVHYPPVTQSLQRRHAVLIAQPYGHESTRAHRNLQQLALQLAQHGFDCVRFDYAGTGDSDGGAERIHLAQWSEDIQQVVRLTRESLDVKWISLVGLRLGANLLHLTPIAQVKHFIAWDPIASGRNYLANLQQMHRRELTDLTRYLSRRTSGHEELLGYVWPERFQREIAQLSWCAQPCIEAERCAWLTSANEEPTDSQLLANAIGSSAWPRLTCTDEIYWDKLMYANRAFASARISQTILNLLTEVE